MKKGEILKLLNDVAKGLLSADEGVMRLKYMPYIDIGCANIDTHRQLRSGFTEIIYGEGKTYEQIKLITKASKERGLNIFATRVDIEKGNQLTKDFNNLDYDPLSRTFSIIQKDIEPLDGKIAICCAGTADIPVAEEAYKTAKFLGSEPKKYYDVGVAGLHRLISKAKELTNADVIIVVAGMEGALPSVVGGMFHQPIIAVPTSVGYGVNSGGISALMSMLGSCAEGVVVVNIDNGFGAACAAVRIFNHYANKKNI